ncbi:MAG: ATP synthase F1 subunit gamma [Epsilonproteobacteria bacterium]|nr:MAG: ATP synthase F1 subunit gamma [Campylobacterota bacterium]RLA67586.1 MAG: ATP synthase F1 subunit gamma [Campylobacterota bacterium]
MANIKDLKKKIKSTKGTFKITSAMKLVSSAKLGKAQKAILGARPYAQEMENTIRDISALVQDYKHDFLKESPNNNQSTLLVISSDKGLCGGYNSQLAKGVRQFIAEKPEEEFKVYFIGKKVKEVIYKDVNVEKIFTFEKSEPTFEELTTVGEELAQPFRKSEVGRVYVAYNHFNSAISFDPTFKKILPMTLDKKEIKDIKKEFPFDFKYEPDATELLDTLIEEAVKDVFYTSFLDAQASEHGSRMAAMDSAAKNCNDIIKKLTLKMNKLRQAAITTELIEVVSGAESLNA